MLLLFLDDNRLFIVFLLGMKISWFYIVVLFLLRFSLDEREYDGWCFYLMIKMYFDGIFIFILFVIDVG